MGRWERMHAAAEAGERSMVLAVVALTVAAIGGVAIYAAVAMAVWRAVAG